MADRRVIVYFMAETEEDPVRRLLKNASFSGGHAVGSISEEGIAELKAKSIVVEEVEAAQPPGDLFLGPSMNPGGASESMPHTAGTKGVIFDDSAELAGTDPSEERVFKLVIAGPDLMPEWRHELERLGVRLLERLSGSGDFTASFALSQLGRVRALPFVGDLRLFGEADTPAKIFAKAPPPPFPMRSGKAPVLFDILLHSPEFRDGVRQWLEDHQLAVTVGRKRRLRVALPARSPLLTQIRALNGVRQVTEYVEPTLANQVARGLLGLAKESIPGAPLQPLLKQTGRGEIVGVADSGLDARHPDFQGRIEGLIARARADARDLHGHGTHVAGSLLGDGKASQGANQGAAPEARLFFQSIMDEREHLTGLPLELSDLFEEAYQAGARIHNNSWSANTKSFYTFDALEVDEFVAAHPDLLIAIAAGNEGNAADVYNVDTGFVDWQSIGSPAIAKNALTVGASRSSRSASRFGIKTYREFDSGRFPDPPIAADKVSGDPQSLAGFSSRGPCDPRRIKPDVVAPGTDILSARSRDAPESSFWGVLPEDPTYAYLGGTSMATPLVAGCAALVRQYFREERQHLPTAALLKAVLINSTRRLEGPDAVAIHSELPNYNQGFGAVYMPNALPNQQEPWLGLHFVDTSPEDGIFRQADASPRKRYEFFVRGGKFLRLCLVWTDPPAGSSLQNVIGLMLQQLDGTPSPKIFGNRDRPDRLGELDRDNNVQIIRLDDPPVGRYRVQVFAANLLTDQDWALVVTGDLRESLIDVT